MIDIRNAAIVGLAICAALAWGGALVERSPLAQRSAAWFWRSRGLNALADAGKFEQITKRINGGLNGYADRLRLWEKAKAVLA